MDYIELESNGSLVTNNGLVFPIDCSEAPETASEAEDMMGVHIYDVNDEWWESMNLEDAGNLFRFLADNSSLYNTQGYMSWAVRMYEVVERANGIEEVAYEDSWYYSNTLG